MLFKRELDGELVWENQCRVPIKVFYTFVVAELKFLSIVPDAFLDQGYFLAIFSAQLVCLTTTLLWGNTILWFFLLVQIYESWAQVEKLWK